MFHALPVPVHLLQKARHSRPEIAAFFVPPI